MNRFWTKPLRLPRLKPYVPKPTDPAIYWFNSERDDIVHEVIRRVVDQHSGKPIEYVLNEVAYHEVDRLGKQRDDESRESLGYWRGLLRRIAKMSENEKRETLQSITTSMAKDIAGNFDPRVYALAGHAVPRILTGVMNPSALPRTFIPGSADGLAGLLVTEGCIEKLKVLAKKGTLIFVPTHSSNLDSVALGYALIREGLPPVSYGAGKNLFTNPVISFFMHNLGAYRLDRRIKASIYKDIVKAYSATMIERGYHSLFFPGGTRSRSGMIETRLKLGLAGTGVEAFGRNYARGVERPIYFVPTTINYALVLEAETLVDEFLKDAGKARFLIDDDEFSKIDRWIDFFGKLPALSSACVIRFAEPLDPFGNEVDDEGRSLNPNGKPIDAVSYVLRDGKPVSDTARDAAYTKELGDKIAERYLTDTVIMSTQLVAHVLFRAVVEATPDTDLFARLRHKSEVSMPIDMLQREVGEARDAILSLEAQGRVRASPALHRDTPEFIVDRALSFWSGYHTRIVASRNGVDVVAEDPAMLLFYQNRLVNYAIDIATPEHMAAATEIARMGLK